MAFFLRKFIEALLLPLGLSGLLVLAGLAFRRRGLALLGVGILYVASTPFAAVLLMKPLEAAYPERMIADSPDSDAVVLLAGGIVRGVSKAGIQWGEAANRFFTAVDLKLAGKGRFLVLTDGNGPRALKPGHGDLLRDEAIRRGVPADQIILIGRVFTTEDEARAVAALPGIRNILLVTSAFHLPRATMLFSAFGMRVTPFPTDQRGFTGRKHTAQDFVPIADEYRTSEAALREYYGLAVYKVLLTLHPPARPAVTASAPAAGSFPQ